MVTLVAAKPHQTFICRQFAAALAVVRQGEPYPTELFLILRQMPVQQFLITTVRRIGRVQLSGVFILFSVVKAGADAEDQRYLIGIFYLQCSAHRAECAALGKSGQSCGEENAVFAAGTAVIDQHVGVVRAGTAVVVVVISAVQGCPQVDHCRLAGGNVHHQHPIRF